MIDVLELQTAIHEIRPFSEVTVRFGKYWENAPFEVIIEFKVFHRYKVFYAYLNISGHVWPYWTVELVSDWFRREFEWIK